MEFSPHFKGVDYKLTILTNSFLSTKINLTIQGLGVPRLLSCNANAYKAKLELTKELDCRVCTRHWARNNLNICDYIFKKDVPPFIKMVLDPSFFF